MGGIKVYVSNKTEEKFRKASMTVFGYRKGSLSTAAEQAFEQWSNNVKAVEKILDIPKDPVAALKSITIKAKGSSVELQHKSSKIRVQKLFQKIKR